MDPYKKFTQPFDKYSKFYAKAFAAQSIARKMQYEAVLNSKAVPVGLKKSMLTPSIKLSACIIDTYLNSSSIRSLQKSIQKLQNTYTSSVQQQAIELITVSQNYSLLPAIQQPILLKILFLMMIMLLSLLILRMQFLKT